MTFTWNDAALATLIDDRKNGTSVIAIAKKLGITRNAVMGKLARFGMLNVQGPRSVMVKAPAVVWPATGRCLFGKGDPLKEGFSFCGEKVDRPGSAWCAGHHAIVYVPAKPHRSAAE